jgi:hypothetical protein
MRAKVAPNASPSNSGDRLFNKHHDETADSASFPNLLQESESHHGYRGRSVIFYTNRKSRMRCDGPNETQ